MQKRNAHIKASLDLGKRLEVELDHRKKKILPRQTFIGGSWKESPKLLMVLRKTLTTNEQEQRKYRRGDGWIRLEVAAFGDDARNSAEKQSEEKKRKSRQLDLHKKFFVGLRDCAVHCSECAVSLCHRQGKQKT